MNVEASLTDSDSQAVLEQILNRLDACVYITDLETDEILFINEKMRREFGLEGDMIGHKCWKALQDGFVERCAFCPKYRLAEHAETSVVWEEYNTATKKYYRNTDCIVQWAGGRKAHMQHSVDINDMKTAEEVLRQRLAQQRLMSLIAGRFAGAGDFDALTRKALEEVGEFMDADLAYVLRDVPEEDCFLCTSYWSPGKVSIGIGTKLSYAEQRGIYDVVRQKQDAAIDHITEIRVSDFLPSGSWGVIGQITVPLFVGERFWGCLGIASRNRDAWDESASQLARLVGGVFSAALERCEVEQKLYSAEQTLRSVVDNVSLAIFWKDIQSRFAGGNRALASMVNLPMEEIAGKTDFDFLLEESAQSAVEDDWEVIRTGEPLNVEKQLVFSGGEERWMHITKSLVKNEAGEPVSIVGIFEDITERKKNELQLLRMSSVLENSPQYIAYINRKGQFDYFNPVAEEVTGYTPEELRAGGTYILYDEETQTRLREEILPEIYAKGRCDFEVPLTRKDGAVRHMAFSGFLVDGEGHNCATIAADITERKQLERDLIRENKAALRASEAKTEFLSRMSHEIRTPMNAIIGMTDIARGANNMDKIHACLEKTSIASKHLLGIINDILDMAKIEAKHMELTDHEFKFERMVMDAMSVVNFLGEEKRQKMMVRLDRRLPKIISSDEMRLKQVITNLLSNAVKFTDLGGEIQLNVELAEQEGTSVKILFEVIDNGIGMDQTQVSRLFTPFEQGDGSITRRYGGTGLGLAISKQLVELMGGEIWVESEPGKGSTFRFTIRATAAEAQVARDGRKYSSARILAVDDSPEIRDYFSYVLEGFPIRCDLAVDGEQALALVRKLHEEGATYDAIFVDWDMPGMNGVETARHIQEIVGEDIVIIMISSYKWDVIETEAKSAGIRQFIPKPLFPSALLEAIYSSKTTVKSAEKAGGHGDAPQSLSGYRVLLAEDVEVNREIVTALLESTGAELVCAETGRQAVEVFRRDDGRFDLILMDIHMPEMDGHEATRLIRAAEAAGGKSVPIIAMTADAFREDVEKCRQSGMNGHIAKPISRDELFAALSRYLHGRPKFAAAAAAPEVRMMEDFTAVVNVEEGVARLLGNRKLYLKLLGSARIRELSDRLMQLVAAGEREEARHVAHELKGVSANLSLTAICTVVSEAEMRLKNGEAADDLMHTVAEAADETVRAIAELCKAG